MASPFPFTTPFPFVRSRAGLDAGLHPSHREVFDKVLPGTGAAIRALHDDRGATACLREVMGDRGAIREIERALASDHTRVLVEALASIEADAPPPVSVPSARK